MTRHNDSESEEERYDEEYEEEQEEVAEEVILKIKLLQTKQKPRRLVSMRIASCPMTWSKNGW